MPFKSFAEIPEGFIINGIFNRRMIKSNQNVLACVIGKTGSGKSWFCLSVCEKWYKQRFNRPFPVENVCFSVDELMKRIISGKLERGELLILEEGGVNAGNLDFQSKISKAFNYVLQSFRSINVGLIINLPVFTMLNNQTRMLLHYQIETLGIDRSTSKISVACLNLDYNTLSGQLYRHFPQVKVNNFMEKVNVITYSRPSQQLVEQYEKKKAKFVMDTIEFASKTSDKGIKVTEMQACVFYLREIKKLSYKEIGERMGILYTVAPKYYTGAIRAGLTVETLPKWEFYYKKLEN